MNAMMDKTTQQTFPSGVRVQRGSIELLIDAVDFVVQEQALVNKHLA